MSVVAALALLSRVAPSLLPTTPVPQSDGRLAYPLTYWNALGVFCAVAAVLCLHLAANDTRRDIRVASAAALPVIGVTLLLTYSRGGLGAAAIGLILYAILGRPRGLISALTAAGPATAIAMKVAYDQTLLSSADPTLPAAIHQGHHLALVVLVCVVLAGVLRTLLLRLDRLLEGERSPIDLYQKALRRFALVAAAAGIVVALVLGAPAGIANRWDQFVDQQAPAPALLRDRLSSTSNDGRIALWNVAIDTFRAHPLDGTGADTYEIAWYEQRPNQGLFVNAHSLYIETLSDLGLVGLACVLLFVLGTLVGLAPIRRGRDRAVYAAIFSAGLAWAVHAGVDWDWQMPAVSLWFAALGGLALGRPDWRVGSATTGATVRIFIVGAAVLAVAVGPGLVLVSQVRLNDATAAYASGNCSRADHFARGSLEILGTRAAPWQIEALCSVRDDQFRRAETDLRGGLAVDPNDWQLQSALAAATAAAGSDARTEVATARALDPNDPTISALARALAHGPSAKARRAGKAFLSQQTLISSG
jgi:O-antigen ligase